MNRLSFARVEAEITRKCNLKCAHCAKGDAQNIDMSHDAIDAFLSKTAVIYRLYFTGGEPTLNIDGMRYFLEACKKYHVALCYMSFTTNGTIQNQELIELVKDYYDYISNFLENDGIQRTKVDLVVSVDRYHEKYTDCDSNYQWYMDNLSDFANVTKTTGGNVPAAIGRGKALPYSIITYNEPLTKIQYKSKESKCYCSNLKQYPLLYPEQIIILCKINVYANGIIGTNNLGSYDDDDCEKWHICDVFTKDYLKAIDVYNEDKPYCLEIQNKSMSISNAEKAIQFFREGIKRLDYFEDSSIKFDYLYKMINPVATAAKGNKFAFMSNIFTLSYMIGLNPADVIKKFENFQNTEFLVTKSSEMSNKWILSEDEKQFFAETQATEAEIAEMLDCIFRERYGDRYGVIIGKYPQLTQDERESFKLYMECYDISASLKRNHPSTFADETMETDTKRLLDFCEKHNIKFADVKECLDNPTC